MKFDADNPNPHSRSMTIPFSQLINQLYETADFIGPEETERVLKQAQSGHVSFKNEHTQYVVTQVSQVMNIPIYQILYGTERKNDRIYAIGFATYYLHTIHEMNMEHIGSELNKSSTRCCIYYGKVIKLNSRFKSDVPKLAWKERLDAIFNSPKEQQQT